MNINLNPLQNTLAWRMVVYGIEVWCAMPNPERARGVREAVVEVLEGEEFPVERVEVWNNGDVAVVYRADQRRCCKHIKCGVY